METSQGSSPEPGEPTGLQSSSTPGPAPGAQPPAAAAPPVPPPPATPSNSWEAPPEAETPGPAPGVRFAPHGGRLVAYIVDAIIVGIVVTLLSLLAVAALGIGFSGNINDASTWSVSGGSVVVFIILMIIIVLVAIAYFPYFWYRGGQTPGMRLFHLRVVRDRDGGPISGGEAVLRYVGYIILLGTNVIGLIGFGWILIDKRRRGWHDLLAGTIVVDRAD